MGDMMLTLSKPGERKIMKVKVLLVILIISLGVNIHHFLDVVRTEKNTQDRPSDMRIFQNTMLFFKDINARQADGDYIFFGDSLVQGMSPYAIGVNYVNMGVGGYKISQINSLIGI
ncbi:TPA: hypothetical protein N6556_001115 [Escherichia coli]|uniref:hypothetical protein n=1 Tax=Escherichia coli TaxID=562 RepID=UPI001B29AE0A|nr:hypothetical protein [Escherichia coli]EFO5530264.1 hypothetical protein [Escherichia coli]EIZ0489612.1 hypothetical protein [Escherichia coli]EIZ7673071.1 hypothetical protein [Escherichia coli]EKK0998828.1 hypothetical protein [Escherichia coli]MCV2928509.1 hypothetical protein [Escherichia coli]